jgi:hypothetical protein
VVERERIGLSPSLLERKHEQPLQALGQRMQGGQGPRAGLIDLGESEVRRSAAVPASRSWGHVCDVTWKPCRKRQNPETDHYLDW